MQLIRVITRTGISSTSGLSQRPFVSVAILGQHDDDSARRDYNIECCKVVIDSDKNGILGGFRQVQLTVPKCGPGQEQSDPSILYQRTYSGYDGDGNYWIINYSVVMGI